MTTVRQVFESAGLTKIATVRWGETVPLDAPGVYVVATTAALDDCPSPTPFPVDRNALAGLCRLRKGLRVDGEAATPLSLATRLQRMWLPTEAVLYVGLAGTSVRTRVGQYYQTPLGARAPHAGGWPIKALSSLKNLWVHFAPAPDPVTAEKTMLAAFAAGVPAAIAKASCDPGLVLPYANLMQPGGRRKAHGITGAREERGAPRVRGAAPALPRTSPAVRPAANRLDAINDAIQRRMRVRGDRCVTAVEAAGWLDAEGLLKDSATRRGLPLRRLLRAGRIVGQRQEGGRFWFIDRKA